MFYSHTHGFKTYGHYLPTPTITVRAIVDTGSCDEVDNYGIAHFTEHLMFKGTTELNNQAINREISRLGDSNAYTSFGNTVYYINCLPEDMENALNLLSKLIFDSQFLEEEVEKERNVILEEYQSGVDSPGNYFYNESLSLIFGEELHPVIGTKESISNITREDIVKFKTEKYTKNRIAFAVVGDIDKEEVLSCYDRVLCKYKDTPSPLYTPVFSSGRQVIEHEFQHSSTQTMMGLYFATEEPSKWKETDYIAWLFESGFGNGSFIYNMLYNKVREELGLCYSIGSCLYTMRGANTIIVIAKMDGTNFEIVKNETIKVLETIAQDGFPDDFMELAKKSLIYDIISRGISPSSHAHEWIDGIFRVPYIDIEGVRIGIDSITNQDIKKYAQKTLDSGFAQIRMN